MRLKSHSPRINQKFLRYGDPGRRIWQALLLACLLLTAPCTFAGQASRIAVLYPESGSRVGQIYASIIQGMQKDGAELHEREFSVHSSVPEIEQWLDGQDFKAVVLLGKQGLQLSDKLQVAIPVITGAHVGVVADRSAVTLAADPRQLLRMLKQLKPEARRVSVIYNEARSGWLIAQARVAAKQAGVSLNAIKADSMQAAGLALKQVVNQAQAGRDAIWLAHDPILPVKALLPELLKTAWEKDLIIFSGNPYHVQQGTLFALYPDYAGLGRQLTELVLRKIKKNGRVSHESSRYLKSAINLRTAAHLGVRKKRLNAEPFNLVFPVRR